MLIRIFTRTLKVFAGLCLLLLASSCGKDPHYLGYVEAYLVYVSPPVSGQLYDLEVTRGDPVKIDQTLYQLDPEPERSYLSQAQYTLAAEQETLSDLENGQRNTILDALRANVLGAEAQLALSKITLARNQRLYEKNVASKSALDEAQADYSMRLEEVNQLKSNLAEAELVPDRKAIKALSL